MDYRDYYKILELDKTATEADIKRAYRRLARKHHPDVNAGDKKAEERFKEINEAYEVLSDPDRRSKYDKLGSRYHEWQRRGGTPGGFNWGQWATPGTQGGARVDYGDLSDLFGQGGFQGGFSEFFNAIFGGMGSAGAQPARRRGVQRRGRDVEQEVEITLEEALQGTRRLLEKEGHRLEAKIPAGAAQGAKIRFAGEGGSGMGGASAGDLYLVVKFAPHPLFEADGSNLRCDLPLPLYTAVLGGELSIPTLDGQVNLKIPPETQSGQIFRLRNKGLPQLRQPDKRGDLLVKVQITIPQELTADERKLFKQLQELRKSQEL